MGLFSRRAKKPEPQTPDWEPQKKEYQNVVQQVLDAFLNGRRIAPALVKGFNQHSSTPATREELTFSLTRASSGELIITVTSIDGWVWPATWDQLSKLLPPWGLSDAEKEHLRQLARELEL